MLGKIVVILGMIKFSHTVFAMPFAVMGAFLAGDGGAGGFCGWGRLFLIVWCMVFARSVAMTFNRIVDALIDGRNLRTAGRAIPAGQVSKKQAYLFLYVCSFMFAVGTYLFWRPLGSYFGYGNYWPGVFCFPTLLFICLYSFTKRFTWGSHFWLGCSLMLAPIGAWVAISPPVGPLVSVEVLILGGAVVLWTSGFDIIYACQDVEFDRREGLYSLPASMGVEGSLWVSRLCHSLAVTLLLFLAMRVKSLGVIYFWAVVGTAVLLVVEHVLVRNGKMRHIQMAFGVINGIVSILLAVAGIWDILLG